MEKHLNMTCSRAARKDGVKLSLFFISKRPFQEAYADTYLIYVGQYYSLNSNQTFQLEIYNKNPYILKDSKKLKTYKDISPKKSM